MVNGSRMDIEAVVERYVRNASTKEFNVEVIVNDTRIVISEDRLTKEKDYWQ